MKKFNITVNGTVYQVEVEEITDGAAAPAAPAPQAAPVQAAAPVKAAPAQKPAPKPAAAGAAGAVKISAPMPGNIIKILVSAGQSIKKGDILCLLEAMKMENEIVAPQDGTVASVNTTQGASVNTGDLLLTLN